MKPRAHTLVVGGTKGIGRALARRLAEDGQLVSVVGRSHAESFKEETVNAYAADVTDDKALEAALSTIVRAHGPVSAAVLSQRYRGDVRGEGAAGAFEDDWAGEIATSLTATRSLLDWAGGHLEDRGDGKAVVVIGSLAGSYIASEQPVGYHMAKAAIAQIVRYYAVTLGPKGIRVNAVSPGTIVKEESKPFYAAHPELEQLYRDIVPLGRMGTAEDVADLVGFLLSARASFLTGQNIVLDGGVSLHSHESLARGVSPLKDLPVVRPRGKPTKP